MFLQLPERLGTGEAMAHIGRALLQLVERLDREEVVVGSGEMRGGDERQSALFALDGELAVAAPTLGAVVAAATQRSRSFSVDVTGRERKKEDGKGSFKLDCYILLPKAKCWGVFRSIRSGGAGSVLSRATR